MDNRTIRLKVAQAMVERQYNEWDKLDGGEQGYFLQLADAAVEALSALPAVDGWLGIESAPKDGTTFLAWCKHGQYVISWDDDLWTVDDNKSDYIPLRGEWPTHWQPLPAPPEIE